MLTKSCSSPLLLFALVLLCNASVKISRMNKNGMLGAPSLPPSNIELGPLDNWFTQLLDHFQPTDTRTWKQRYQVRRDFYSYGGPVFLMIGGEGEVNPRWMVQGAWVDYAEKYNALMFQVEHRYYGKSQPTSDLSVENLQYLSSEQALADLAYFVALMTSEHNLPPNTKWVAFGGSYAGNLAAWVRLKYPHLIHASMSASAPVLAKLDFPEYMEVVKSSLATHSPQCVEAVEAANEYVNMLLKTPSGQNAISEKFRLCSPIDTSNMNDVASLLDSLADIFADVVQYNEDNRFFNYNKIDELCDIMVDETLGIPVNRYAEVNILRLEVKKIPCLDYKYENHINELKDITWVEGKSARQWMYQICTEFGFFQSSESKRALFGEDFPVDFFIQQCRDIFGEQFTKELLEQAVYRTNTIYGGLDLQATRVVYVHGSIDPWHALGITKTRIPQSPAIFIYGTGHCANMLPPAYTDLPALTAAREEISYLIGKWLEEP